MDPPTEVAAQRLAALQGLAPEVFMFDVEAGEMSMAYVEGQRLEADWMWRPTRVELLQQVIKQLRRISAAELPALDLPARLVQLHERLGSVDAERARPWSLRVQQCVRAWQATSGVGAAAVEVLVHGDLGVQNILLRADGTPSLLDWEYAHRGHPDEDLAGLEAQLAPDAARVLQLASWSVEPRTFGLRVELRRLLDGLWYDLARVIDPRDPATSA